MILYSMDKNIQLSIIVVSLNTKDKFEKTINSIDNQILKNYELIVVDGKSSDGTAKLIEKYQNIIDKKIIETDTGIYDAMNKGIKISSTKWCMFLNSGDIFYENFTTEKISQVLNHDVDVIFSDTIVQNNDLEYLSVSNYFSKKISKIPFCHQSSIVKTDLLRSYGFSLNYSLSSDFDFFLKIFISGKKFFKIKNLISKVDSGGVSDKKRFLVFCENFKILKNNQFLKFNVVALLLDFLYLAISSFIDLFISKRMKYYILKGKYLFLDKINNNQIN